MRGEVTALSLYPSDLSDSQWETIRKFIPCARRGGRPRTTDVRQIVNAVFYLNRVGCAWRYLPKQSAFPPWQTVYDYFSRWSASGVWQQIHDYLVTQVRKSAGRNEATSVLIVDSQSIKAPSGEDRGYDGFKKVRGRKRNLFVDTLGLIHSVKVNGAQKREDRSAIEMMKPDQPYYPQATVQKLSAFYADGAYKAHDFQNEIKKRWGIWPTLKTASKKVDIQQVKPGIYQRVYGYQVSSLKPVRWIVERTFSWFNHYRRLAKDYERKTKNSETMIQLAMTQIMLTRLNPAADT
jgi:putative transposase